MKFYLLVSLACAVLTSSASARVAEVDPAVQSLQQLAEAPGAPAATAAQADPYSKCPSVCTLEYDPVCAVEFCDDYQTFPNDCARIVENCRNKREFKVVAKAECLI